MGRWAKVSLPRFLVLEIFEFLLIKGDNLLGTPLFAGRRMRFMIAAVALSGLGSLNGFVWFD